MHNEEAQGNGEARPEETKPEVVRAEDIEAGEAAEEKSETQTTEPQESEEQPSEQTKTEDSSADNKAEKAEETAEEKAASRSVVGIRFEPCGKVYRFQANGLGLKLGERVVVESELGVSIGRVVIEGEEQKEPAKELKPVLRRVTEADLKQEQDNKAMRKEAFDFCNERIMARGLAMKLLGTDVTLDKKRIVFFFSAETRIDFRELVKDLAAKFRTRIELRQVGVRDAARITGGLGVCGRELCCRRFLTSFLPISIKMAKKQELALNTSKLSGICGRLMCCLGYEYEEKLKELKKKERKEPEERKVEQKREQRPESKEPAREPAVQKAPEAPEPAREEKGTEAPSSAEEGAPSRKRRRRRRRRSGKRPDAQGQGQAQPERQAQEGKPAEARGHAERPTAERPAGEKPSSERSSGEKPSGDKPAEGAGQAKKPFRRKRRRRMKGKKKE